MPDDPEPPSRRTALAAMVLILLLVLGGIWLARRMHDNSRIEDCLMAGRRNCAPIAPNP
ncbi:MAG: hypothetical protein J0H91_08625 [Rhodospirillales bacterium]|nr:hypothetical protein [Rhodospirillales bacterium]